MNQPKIACPYCNQYAQLKMLKCCFSIICQSCYQHLKKQNNHECALSQLFITISLNNQEKIKHQLCSRCNIKQSTQICYNCSNKSFCHSCFNEIHKRLKFSSHKSIQINNKISRIPELECQNHGRARNLILQNCTIGCVKCAEQLKLRKISIIQDKQNFNENKNHELCQLIEIKLSELSQNKLQVQNKWSTLCKQINQQFSLIHQQIKNRQKQVQQSLDLMRKQQMKSIEDIQRNYTISKDSLKALQIFCSRNQNIKKIEKIRISLIHQQVKKLQKRKIALQNIQHKKLKCNIQNIVNQLKTLGVVEKFKVIKDEDKQNIINRSSQKSKTLINVCDASNRKRSQSKDALNTSNVSALKESQKKHQRAKSTTKFDADDKKSVYAHQTPNKINPLRQKINKNSMNIQISKEYLVMNESNTSNYVTQNSNIITQKTSIQMKPAVNAERYKNEFLHLRESVKKNSSYRQSLLKR